MGRLFWMNELEYTCVHTRMTCRTKAKIAEEAGIETVKREWLYFNIKACLSSPWFFQGLTYTVSGGSGV